MGDGAHPGIATREGFADGPWLTEPGRFHAAKLAAYQGIFHGLVARVKVRERVKAASPALKFVLMVGVMSFFADFTYEGSRSIVGPYLGMLGAGACSSR
jgi:hypothetical protein